MIPIGKADRERGQRAQADVAAALDDRHAEAGERAELGPDDHRADDQDRRAEEDPDRGDQAGEDHEERGSCRPARSSPRCGPRPPPRRPRRRRSRGAARSAALGGVGDLRVDLLERDRALAGDAELLAGRRSRRWRPRGRRRRGSRRRWAGARHPRGGSGCRPRASPRAGRGPSRTDSEGTTIRRWTMAAAYPRPWSQGRHLGSAPCSPTTTCTCAPTRRTPRPSATSRRRTSSATSAAAAAAGIEELGVSEHVHRFRQALELWRHPFWEEQARDDLDAYCEFVARHRRCGSASSAISSPAPRTAPPPCSRRASSTTWSARSTSSARARSTTRAGTSGRAGATPTRSGAATSRRSPSAPAPASSTSSPTPTWSRSGAAPGRCPSATRATTTSPRWRRSPRAGSRSRSRPPGLRKPVGELYPAPAFAEMCVEAGAAFALSSDAHLPEQVGYGYERAVEFLAELGRRRRSASSRAASAGWSRSAPRSARIAEMSVGIGYDSHRFAEGRRLVLGGVEIEHERGLAGHSDADVLTHAVIDALLGAAGDGRHRHALPRRRGALARRRLDRPAAHRRRHDRRAHRQRRRDRRLRGAAAGAAPGGDGADPRRGDLGPGQRQGDQQRGHGLDRPRRGNCLHCGRFGAMSE